MYKTIIWDWNGTLLDDLELSLGATNSLLEDRNLPKLSVNRYKEIFKLIDLLGLTEDDKFHFPL